MTENNKNTRELKKNWLIKKDDKMDDKRGQLKARKQNIIKNQIKKNRRESPIS